MANVTNADRPQDKPDIDAVLRIDGAGRRARLTRRLAIWGVVAAVIAGSAYLLLAQGGKRTAIAYVTEAATRADIIVIVTATGSVQPTNKVDVSSELSGVIRRVLVDFNSPVKVGQPLAELDTDKLKAAADSARARVAAARAGVLDARATLTEKELDLVRKRDLAKTSAGTTQNFEAAQAARDRAAAALASAQAEVAVAEADLKLAETNLSKACICSPIDGVVLNRNVDPGQTVATSFQAPVLFTLAEDLRKMEIQVDVDEADVGKVRDGQAAIFTVDAYPEHSFRASIREIRFGSEVVQGVVTYKAVLTADNPDLLLRPGMTATAEIVVQQIADALAVPNAALRFSPGGDQSPQREQSLLQRFLPGPPRFRAPSGPPSTGASRTLWLLRDGMPTPVEVEIGASDGRRTEIRGGALEPGDAVIVDATNRQR
jgi:HlyD family secretion protein